MSHNIDTPAPFGVNWVLVTAQDEEKLSRTEWDRLIEEFLEHLQIERSASPLTIRNYRHYLTRFSVWLKENSPGIKVSALDLATTKRYRVYLARLEPSLSPITQSYHIIALRALLRWLIKNDQPTLAPEKLDLPKARSRSLKFLTTEQVERLLNQPSISKPQGLRDKAILEVLFSTGLRVSELVKLNRDKVDLKRGEFGVIGKGGRARVVFLSPRTIKWLERYLVTRSNEDKALFIRYSGGEGEKRLTARSVQRIVKRYGHKCHLPFEVTPHVIRHSFATDLLMAGADLRSVQEMLGHKNIATTQIYTHVTNKQLRTVHQAFHGKGK